MELHFLGTGAGVPSKQRNTSAIALKFLNHYQGALWLFDCGEATQHQILHTTLKLSKLDRIFITHLHGDHLFGLPGLLGSRSFQGGHTPLTIYGPAGTERFVKTVLSTSETSLHYSLHIHEIHDGMVLNFDNHYIHIKELEHGIPSYGYRIVEKDSQGELLVERLREIGVKPGPIYKAIKNGERVTLDDGRVIDGKDFVGPKKKGRILTILGDTRRCDASISLAMNADVLIHEATFKSDDKTLAYNYFHSTSLDAATIAKQANVSKLILTHLSSRYQMNEIEALVQEAREIFPQTFIAHDFEKFTL